MADHEPRLVNAGIACDTGYCAVCEHCLTRLRPFEGGDDLWRAVWSGSAICTGAPLVVR